jgi:ATP adenylyltransferase
MIDPMSCPLCREVRELPESALANEVAVQVPDAHPLSEGHVLVVPRTHVERIEDLEAREWLGLFELVRVTARRAVARAGVDGINIGVNSGEAAGQTVAHAHVHVIPRRVDDCDDPRGGVRWALRERAVYWR